MFAQVTASRISFATAGFGQNLNVVLAGDDANALLDTAARIEHELRTIANIGGASSSAALLKPEIAVKPDFAKMAELGVTSAALSDAIRIGTTGDTSIRLPKLSLPSRQIPIRVQLDAGALKSIDTLRLLRVPTRNGSTPLSSIANIELSSGPAQISRYDRHRNVNILVPLNGHAISDVAKNVFALPALKHLPAGVQQQESGDLERQRQLGIGFVVAMVTGIFCVYGVLAILFNDLLQPITILLALPLSLGGAVAALAIGGYPLAVSSMIGLLMLMGIAVKNSILLVDYTVLGEEQGLDRNEALMDACIKRARPIVMTSIAMAAGMIPTALNLSGNSGFRAPMGMAVLGGLFTSTILSLLVIPAAYTYIADFESWTRRWRHRMTVDG
jgi:multidrug efflux pump subunit AcrB